MYFAKIQPLTTERLVLRKLTLDDAGAFYTRLASSETVTKYMLWQPHKDLSESVASIEKALRRYKEGGYYRWAIVRREDDAFIGIIDLLRFDETDSSCSFAYMLGEDYWGMGYGTESVKAVFAFAFQELQVQRIEADHFTENPASGAVMRKAGMTFQKAIPRKYEKNGIPHDAAAYRITREQWKKTQGQP